MAREEYEIRTYQPADREAILELYRESVGDRSGAWFDWRYVDNPFLDEETVVVAEYDGEVVAARPSLPVPLSVGGEPVLALVHADPVVRPAHRRDRLIERLVTRAHERYAAREPSVSIEFPGSRIRETLDSLANEGTLPAAVHARYQEYSRVQAPATLADAVTDGGAGQAIGQLATPAVKGYLSVRDRLSSGDEGLQVERFDGAKPERLAALAAERKPRGAHAHRSAAFYRWRFADPKTEYTTYVARGEWGLVAALVLGRRTVGDTRTATVVEVVPAGNGEEWAEAVSRLLGTALEDARGADVVMASGTVLPKSVLETWRFRTNDAFPHSLFASPTDVLARPLVEEGVRNWVVNDTHLSDPYSWELSRCERELG